MGLEEIISGWRNFFGIRRLSCAACRIAAFSVFLASVAVAPVSGNPWLSGEDEPAVPAEDFVAVSHSVGPFPKPAEEPAPQAPAAGNTTPISAEAGAPDTLVRAYAGIPSTPLKAYVNAEQEQATSQASCNVKWWLLAAIGRIESNHARYGQVDTAGTTLAPILGPQLNGNGFAAIADTDGGALDGDSVWDRAVGPMQFIPSTWQRWRVDGNGDGQASPHNVFDAALAAGKYLCASGRDLSDANQLVAAIYSYNPSYDYVQSVLSWARLYSSGASVIPDAATEASSLEHEGLAPNGRPQAGQPPTIQAETPGGQQASQSPAPSGGNPADSSKPTATAPPDKTPPVVTYKAPIGAISNSSPTITGTATDNARVVSASLSLNGGAPLACSIDSAGKVSCATSGLADGKYSAMVKAADAAGNIGTASGSFTVDTTDPAATYTGPKDNINNPSPTVTGTATDNAGVVSVSLSLNGGATTACSVDGEGKVTCSTSGLADGTYFAVIKVSDEAGNTGTASGSFNVDATAPVVTYTGPAGAIGEHSPTITGTATDNFGVVSVSLSLNGGEATACSIEGEGNVSCPTSGLGDGEYLAQIKAYDAAGNIGTSESSFTVTST